MSGNQVPRIPTFCMSGMFPILVQKFFLVIFMIKMKDVVTLMQTLQGQLWRLRQKNGTNIATPSRKGPEGFFNPFRYGGGPFRPPLSENFDFSGTSDQSVNSSLSVVVQKKKTRAFYVSWFNRGGPMKFENTFFLIAKLGIFPISVYLHLQF